MHKELEDRGTLTMTVAELIAELEKVEDKGLPVFTEGCDCNGTAFRAEEGDTSGNEWEDPVYAVFVMRTAGRRHDRR